MKSWSVREFRARLAELLEGKDPLLVTRHGKSIAIVYPLKHPANAPLEVRREIVDTVARGLAVRPSWQQHSAVIERYKGDVDRTLIRENLRRSPQERLQGLQAMQGLAAEIRKS